MNFAATTQEPQNIKNYIEKQKATMTELETNEKSMVSIL